MSSDAQACRELWALIEAEALFRVCDVMISDTRYRWTVSVYVPWDRFAREVHDIEAYRKLCGELEQWQAAEAAALEVAAMAAAAAASEVVEVHSSGETQLALF